MPLYYYYFFLLFRLWLQEFAPICEGWALLVIWWRKSFGGRGGLAAGRLWFLSLVALIITHYPSLSSAVPPYAHLPPAPPEIGLHSASAHLKFTHPLSELTMDAAISFVSRTIITFLDEVILWEGCGAALWEFLTSLDLINISFTLCTCAAGWKWSFRGSALCVKCPSQAYQPFILTFEPLFVEPMEYLKAV